MDTRSLALALTLTIVGAIASVADATHAGSSVRCVAEHRAAEVTYAWTGARMAPIARDRVFGGVCHR